MIWWILKQTVSVLWRGTPWALGLFFFVVFFAIRISVLSVLSWFVGVPEAARRVANDWTRRALKAGFPTIWERQLCICLEVLAYLSFFLGWSITLFTVVFTFNLMF